MPRHDWIDSVTPDNPVWINRLDGHMALANRLAMNAARVTSATAEVEGGTVVRDASGQPTGVFKDNAQSYIDKVQPANPPELDDRSGACAVAICEPAAVCFTAEGPLSQALSSASAETLSATVSAVLYPAIAFLPERHSLGTKKEQRNGLVESKLRSLS